MTALKADDEERRAVEVRTGLEELVRRRFVVELVLDRFGVGDERSELKAPAPDRNPWCCVEYPR